MQYKQISAQKLAIWNDFIFMVIKNTFSKHHILQCKKNSSVVQRLSFRIEGVQIIQPQLENLLEDNVLLVWKYDCLFVLYFLLCAMLVSHHHFVSLSHRLKKWETEDGGSYKNLGGGKKIHKWNVEEIKSWFSPKSFPAQSKHNPKAS